MKNNVHSAVLIIAVLSLFLGLSLGQLNEKNRELQNIEGDQNRSSVIWISKDRCNMKHRIHLEKRQIINEREQARMERERARAERDEARLQRERAIKRVDKEKIHIILKEEL